MSVPLILAGLGASLSVFGGILSRLRLMHKHRTANVNMGTKDLTINSSNVNFEEIAQLLAKMTNSETAQNGLESAQKIAEEAERESQLRLLEVKAKQEIIETEISLIQTQIEARKLEAEILQKEVEAFSERVKFAMATTDEGKMGALIVSLNKLGVTLRAEKDSIIVIPIRKTELTGPEHALPDPET